MEVAIISGNSYQDSRGELKYVNDFSFGGVKRFYSIFHPDTSIIRAWQGHKIEHKYFHVIKGSFVLAWVKVDDWDNPSKNLTAEYGIFSEESPAVVSVPPGYANGIKGTRPGSILMVYSNLDLAESTADRWSFDPELWLDWNSF